MGLDLKKLIDIIIKGDDKDAKNLVLSKLAISIADNGNKEDICKDIYKEVYGCTLIPELCEELIESLHQGSEHGAKWSKTECNAVAARLGYKIDAKPYTLDEFRAAMHVCYYMMNQPMKDSGITIEASVWGRCANYYFTSDDAISDKLIGLYFSKIHKH